MRQKLQVKISSVLHRSIKRIFKILRIQVPHINKCWYKSVINSSEIHCRRYIMENNSKKNYILTNFKNTKITNKEKRISTEII